jgi:hypothetical protein
MSKKILIKQLAKGIATYIPGVYKVFSRNRTGGTVSARYCYSVWLRHLVMADRAGLPTQPRVIAELGPGDSIGIGLAALLSGSEQYYALDLVKYAATQRNNAIFDELLELFKNRMAIPGETEFPAVFPRLESYEFPHHILTAERLEAALHQDRTDSLRRSIAAVNTRDSRIHYLVPWYSTNILDPDSIDMVMSQAVLEHVDEPGHAYQMMNVWLKPGAFMSHTIDFHNHRTAEAWNGHWTYSDFIWKLIRGRLPFLINRLPHSRHLELINEAGLKVICDIRDEQPSRIDRKDLSRRFSGMQPDDLITCTAFVQASKPDNLPQRGNNYEPG